MNETTGSKGVAHIECVSPKRNRWKIRWNIKEMADGSATYMEEDFDHRPTMTEIRDVILGWYNSKIEQAIRTGFVWNDMKVWLSNENQFNYKTAYDAAIMSDGATLPVIFKFGTDEEPIYHEFTTIEDLSDFYYKAVAYVKSVLEQGWREKDSLDFSIYER